jgi:Protein of unknown function (DUF3822)
LKAVFEILPGAVEAEKSILVCEISNEGFSYAIKNESQNLYVGAAVFHFDKNGSSNDHSAVLETILQQELLLNNTFKKVVIMFSYAESLLIPFELYNSAENENVLNLIHGDLQNNVSILSDRIPERNIYNIYRVPSAILNTLNQKFTGAVNLHQYSILLKQVLANEHKLFVLFYPRKIVLRLIKDGKLEFINNFYYKTAEDVSYVLLNVCNQFDIENVAVEVSGLIDKDSGLYKEIYKYFESIMLATLPLNSNYSEEINQFPSHYFSHIFAVDSCV